MGRLIVDECVVEDRQPIVLRGRGEGVIHRPLDHDRIARVCERAQGRMDSGHHTVGERDPFRAHLHVVPARHPTGEGCEIIVGGVVIAEHIVSGCVHDRLDDLRRRFEFHVGDGHGDHVVIAFAHVVFDQFPFDRCGVASFYTCREVVHALPS